MALVRLIIFQEKPVGSVYIRSDLQAMNDRLKSYAFIVAAVLSVSLMVALLTSSIIGRAIAEPVVQLAETARTVSRDKIYSVRAPATGNRDELAILIGTFNEMLEQIQERDTALQSEIAERKQAEEALRESQDRLTGILGSAMDTIITVDEQQRIVLFNAAAERMFRCPAAEALGQPVEGFVPRRFRAVHSAHIQRFGETGVTNRAMGTVGALWAVRKNGEEFQIEASISQIETGGKKLFTVILRDVTERKQAEEALAGQTKALAKQAEEIRKLNDELEERVILRTAQMEAANKELEAFTYSVSHDLRAPLRHIAGFSGIVLEEFGPTLDPQAQHYLQRIQEGTRKMGQLVDELLNLARVGRHSLSLQVTGLNSIVQEVVSILEPESEGRQVEWKIPELPPVECDPVLIKQVLQNLMANALKFTRPRPRALIEVGQINENGHPAIFVRDNGVGFSMKYAHKLFGVFQRLHRAEDFEGTGVGLALVQRIIKKHGGRVWAEAELDKGATFYFTLGAAAEKTKSRSNAATIGGRS